MGSKAKNLDRRLVIFTGVMHHLRDHNLVAHGGFVREVDLWARIFNEVVVLAPYSDTTPLADEIAYHEDNISVKSLGKYVETTGLAGKVRLVFVSLQRLARSFRAVRRQDIVMARGPDSTGFLGYIVGRMRKLQRFAKYTDQWESYEGEPQGFRIQKMAYAKHSFGGPVMIYGRSDPSRPHLVPFFTSSISKAEWNNASEQIAQREPAPPYRLLFVGRLVKDKGVDILLQALRQLIDDGLPVVLDIVGDGPEREALVSLTRALGLQEAVLFRGWAGGEALVAYYSQAHCFMHASRKEGFGKVLLEAMTFSLPIVGTSVGVSQAIVNPPEAGLLVERENAGEMARAVSYLLADPTMAQRMGHNGRMKVKSMLLEDLEARYREFVHQHLQLAS